jgi:hypothetical protein
LFVLLSVNFTDKEAFPDVGVAIRAATGGAAKPSHGPNKTSKLEKLSINLVMRLEV